MATARVSSASRWLLYRPPNCDIFARLFRGLIHTSSLGSGLHRNDGALARRMTVRPKHFITANKHIKQGILKVAGGLITPESLNAADKKFIGSVLLYEADFIEDVRKLDEQDLYWTENVWDKEKLVMVMATTLQDRAGITQPTGRLMSLGAH